MNELASGRPVVGWLIILFAVTGGLLAQAAMPAGLGWMKGATAAFFTDRDWELLDETLKEALDAAADGDAREWSNEKSGASGRVTPLASERRDDITCRRVRIESLAKGSSSSYRYLFCRRGDGPWGIGQPK